MCKTYDSFYKDSPPIPTQYLKRVLKLILQVNSFEFNGKNYLQTQGTAMGTEMAVAFPNIFMAEVETKILNQSALKPLVWKRYIDDISQFGMYTNSKSRNLPNKQTNTTKLSGSRLLLR